MIHRIENATNYEELVFAAPPTRKRQRLARGWRAVADAHEWLDCRMPSVGIWVDAEPHDQDPRETPADDPRQKTDWPNTKQTDEPWKGSPEKEQLDPNRPKPDLEKWHETNTH